MKRWYTVRGYVVGVDWGNVAFASLVTAIVAMIVVLVWLTLNEDKPHYSVPAELCTERDTGHTREELSHYNCVAWDKQGTCTVQQPVFRTAHEMEVTCRPFTTWR
jgi:hypothetical protein